MWGITHNVKGLTQKEKRPKFNEEDIPYEREKRGNKDWINCKRTLILVRIHPQG